MTSTNPTHFVNDDSLLQALVAVPQQQQLQQSSAGNSLCCTCGINKPRKGSRHGQCRRCADLYNLKYKPIISKGDLCTKCNANQQNRGGPLCLRCKTHQFPCASGRASCKKSVKLVWEWCEDCRKTRFPCANRDTERACPEGVACKGHFCRKCLDNFYPCNCAYKKAQQPLCSCKTYVRSLTGVCLDCKKGACIAFPCATQGCSRRVREAGQTCQSGSCFLAAPSVPSSPRSDDNDLNLRFTPSVASSSFSRSSSSSSSGSSVSSSSFSRSSSSSSSESSVVSSSRSPSPSSFVGGSSSSSNNNLLQPLSRSPSCRPLSRSPPPPLAWSFSGFVPQNPAGSPTPQPIMSMDLDEEEEDTFAQKNPSEGSLPMDLDEGDDDTCGEGACWHYCGVDPREWCSDCQRVYEKRKPFPGPLGFTELGVEDIYNLALDLQESLETGREMLGLILLSKKYKRFVLVRNFWFTVEALREVLERCRSEGCAVSEATQSLLFRMALGDNLYVPSPEDAADQERFDQHTKFLDSFVCCTDDGGGIEEL